MLPFSAAAVDSKYPSDNGWLWINIASRNAAVLCVLCNRVLCDNQIEAVQIQIGTNSGRINYADDWQIKVTKKTLCGESHSRQKMLKGR